MSTPVTCPNCKSAFDLEDILTEDVEKSLKEQYEQKLQSSLLELQKDKLAFEKQLQEFEEKKKKENELFAERLKRELERQRQQQEEQLRKNISADFENQLKILQQTNFDNEEKLKTARQKELSFLQKEQELKNKEAELELSLQRKLQEERMQLTEQIRQQELEKISLKENEFQFRLRELEKQLDDQKKLAEEMKRRAEQGSMQLQGEVQELMLEDILRSAFPIDYIQPVGKGVRGADCVQIIQNNFGQQCGKIIYESKRTKDFSKEWIEKLKTDMRSLGADLAIIVTQAMPKDMDHFGEREGIWICTFSEVKSLAYVLRGSVIKIFNSVKSQQNKGDKMNLLYNYLIGSEFSAQWKAIREGFMAMKISIQKERDAMEKLWKAREKQLEKVLLNAAHIKGSIEGISGSEEVNFNLLNDDEANLLE